MAAVHNLYKSNYKLFMSLRWHDFNPFDAN